MPLISVLSLVTRTSVFFKALGKLGRLSFIEGRLESNLSSLSGVSRRLCSFLEAFWLGKTLVCLQFVGEFLSFRKLSVIIVTSLTLQKREERGADLSSLKSLLHEAIGELRLIGKSSR